MDVPFKSGVPFEWLSHFSEIYGQPAIMSRPAAELYFRAVGCADAQMVIDVMGEWLRTESRFPLPVDLVQRIQYRKVALSASLPATTACDSAGAVA